MMRSMTAWGRGRSAGTWIAADYATWGHICRMPGSSLTKHMLFAPGECSPPAPPPQTAVDRLCKGDRTGALGAA
eukprot:363411-Chlamydomonas_euryale.AAC.5